MSYKGLFKCPNKMRDLRSYCQTEIILQIIALAHLNFFQQSLSDFFWMSFDLGHKRRFENKDGFFEWIHFACSTILHHQSGWQQLFPQAQAPACLVALQKKTSLGADCRVFHPPVQHLKETRLGKGKLRLKISWNGNKIFFFFVLKMGRPDHKKKHLRTTCVEWRRMRLKLFVDFLVPMFQNWRRHLKTAVVIAK